MILHVTYFRMIVLDADVEVQTDLKELYQLFDEMERSQFLRYLDKSSVN